MAEAATPAKAANPVGGSSGGNNTTSSGPGGGNTGGGTDGAAGGATGSGAGASGGASGGNAAAGPGGIPYYEKQRQYLKELINRKRTLEKKIVSIGGRK